MMDSPLSCISDLPSFLSDKYLSSGGGGDSFGWVERLTSQHRPAVRRHRSSSCSSLRPLAFPPLHISKEVYCQTENSSLNLETCSSQTDTDDVKENSELGVFKNCPSCRRLSTALKNHDMWKADLCKMKDMTDLAVDKEQELKMICERLQMTLTVVTPLLRRESTKRWRTAGSQTSRSWLEELPTLKTIKHASQAAEQRADELNLQLNEKCLENQELRARVDDLEETVRCRDEKLEQLEYEMQEMKGQVEYLQGQIDDSLKHNEFLSTELYSSNETKKKIEEKLLTNISQLTNENTSLQHKLKSLELEVNSLNRELTKNKENYEQLWRTKFPPMRS